MELRPYQELTINALYDWLQTNETGNPCVVLPTGSGKSVVIGEFIKSAIQRYPDTRVVMLTHVRELIEQNHEKLVRLWPNAPVGIYSAGLGRREIERITYAGIQSVRKKPEIFGKVNLVIVDEAHLISHKDEGGYRTLIAALRERNPRLRVIGFTATPWRLGHGRIDEGDAIFDALIEPVTIRELVFNKYLAPLVSRATDVRYDMDGIHKRGGEYIESEMQERVDTDDQNVKVATEIKALAGDRRAWLLFCAGVKHAYHVRDALRTIGVSAETITGETPTRERDEIIERYKAGEIRAITNANVLTTGFDYPNIDLIALLRPTMSPGLYMQMVGRGFRPKSHTDHCLVLDFAGVVAMHGPIPAVDAPEYTEPSGDKEPGLAPSKECPACRWIVPAGVRYCINPDCDHEFVPEEKPMTLHHDDIMGEEASTLEVKYWAWEKKVSKSGNDMIVVSYYGSPSDPILREYLLIWNDGFAGTKGRATLTDICSGLGVTWQSYQSVEDLMREVTMMPPPRRVRYERDGKYLRVMGREW